MAEQDSSVSYQFTKLGNDLSVKALAGTVKLDFTKAELSTDNHFNDTEADVAVMTDMGNVAQTVELKEVDAVEDDQSYVKVPVLINEAEITEDYALMTIGLYCRPDDGDEVLYSICSLKDPIYMHKSSNNSTFALNLNTLVGSAANVTIKVDPAGAVTNADLAVTLKSYATIEYVDSAIAKIPKVDLSGYALKTNLPDFSSFATTQALTNAIAAIPKVNLSGYSTTVQMNAAINAAKPNLAPYATNADMTTKLEAKADTSTVNTQLGTKANTTDMNTAVNNAKAAAITQALNDAKAEIAKLPKHVEMTISAYNALATKDANTFYYLSQG